MNKEDIMELYTNAEQAFIPYYKRYIEWNKDQILSRNLEDRPSWEELTSTDHAKDVFHDMILQVLYEGYTKGRQWE